MAKRKHHSEEAIIRILKESEAGMPEPDLLHKYIISQGTFYRLPLRFHCFFRSQWMPAQVQVIEYLHRRWF